MTAEQMQKESQAATEAGMREIAEALAKKRGAPVAIQDDVSDSSTESSPRGRRRRRCRHTSSSRSRRSSSSSRSSSSNSSKHGPTVEVLESRLRFLRLDMANALLEKDRLTKELAETKSHLETYSKANNEFALIKSAFERTPSKKITHEFTIPQLKRRIELFAEEVDEHLTLCTSAIEKIELHQVKAGLLRVVVAERRRFIIHLEELQSALWWHTKLMDATVAIFFLMVVLVVYSGMHWYFMS